MNSVGDGWFEISVDDAQAGTLYRFQIDGGVEVPDPASRYQPEDVNGPSAVVDPDAYRWIHTDWDGLPWHETAFYELHVGTFTADGNFDGVRRKLGHLADLGVTAIELMPIADFAGRRNWGYDGVLPFAPDSAYGTPETLKRLVDEAHGHGLMVFLDVVYNHFGPEGNYLGRYAPGFFTDRVHTPWGAAIDYSRRTVRDFFIHNALYWLEEYRFDGLRLDAVHAIADRSSPDILEELADVVRERFHGRRFVHLVLENDDNQARYLNADGDGRHGYSAQWNDDFHHACHVLATGEDQGYYADYSSDPIACLIRCLSEGFAYQGDPSAYRGGHARGEPSSMLPPTAFVSFLQNHDQVGNRAFGERLSVLASQAAREALTAIMLLAPSLPLLFMGEEWSAREPFLYFCDFHDALAKAVTEGRRNEFQSFPAFREAAARARIPDPNAERTFAASRLDWSVITQAPHATWLALHRTLLGIRRHEIVPHLARLRTNTARVERLGKAQFRIAWSLDRVELTLLANLSDMPAKAAPFPGPARLIHATGEAAADALSGGTMPPWCAAWSLGEA